MDVARAVGSTATLMFIYDLAPGQGSSPYHYEFEEEWMLVVEGTVVVRAPDGEHTLERGAMAYFPAGPAGAHKVMNRSDAPARTLMFSNSRAAGRLGLPGQRHGRRLPNRRRGGRNGLPPRHLSPVGAR